MRLVEDARNWWKWHSTHIFAVVTVFPAVWLSSSDLQNLLPAKVVSVVAVPVGILGIVLRVRKQAKDPPPKPTVPAPKG